MLWENTKFQKQSMTSEENLEVAFYFLVMQQQSHFEVTFHTLYILLLLYIFKIMMEPTLETFQQWLIIFWVRVFINGVTFLAKEKTQLGISLVFS